MQDIAGFYNLCSQAQLHQLLKFRPLWNIW